MNNKKRNKTQKKIDYLYQVAMNNQTTIKILSDFFYNYLDRKGDTDKYAEYMKEKVDGVLQESKDRLSSQLECLLIFLILVLRLSVRKDINK